MVLTEDDDFDKLIKIANNRKKIENGLKNYLSIALSLCREISLNFAETSKVITQAINDLFSNSN